MSHLDEGTLHALLDGELDLHEVKEIQAHIGSCAACGTRLREVKEFHGESDRLVGLLEPPTAPSRRTAVPADAGQQMGPLDDRAVPRPPAPRRPPPRTSGPAAEPPPLLLPEAPDYGRVKFVRRMRWAALILVAVGAGYLGTRARQTGNFDFDGLTLPSGSSDSPAGAVLSSEEATQVPDAGAAADTAPTEVKTTSVPKRVAPRAEPPAPAGERRQPRPATAAKPGALANAGNFDEKDETLSTRQDVAAEQNSAEGADDRGGAEGAAEPAADRSAADQPPVEQLEKNETAPPRDVRVEAARALQQLDRERQQERADAATAALDSARRRELLERAAAAPTPPAPRTPEQRAQIYLRIGLDEAAKQLGRPVHVIEGMSPLFMGLAFGRVSPGADATRPVVRVVYQDSQGRLIMLDQQRLRPGQSTSAPGSEPHWVAGDILLHLRGEVGDDVLRNWRARVR